MLISSVSLSARKKGAAVKPLFCLLLVSCGSGGKEKSGSEDRVCACAGGNTCAGGSTCAGGDACKGQGTCAGQNVAAGDCVEVLCFHGKQRCATCIAIERNTREVLEKEFAFGNARKSPDTFKAGLVKTVSGMLK